MLRISNTIWVNSMYVERLVVEKSEVFIMCSNVTSKIEEDHIGTVCASLNIDFSKIQAERLRQKNADKRDS